MRKIKSHLLLNLGLIIPIITVITSSCNSLVNSSNQNNVSYQNSPNNPVIRKLELNDKEARVIRCKGFYDWNFADIYFYHANNKRFLKIITFSGEPHIFFDKTCPYVTIKVSSQDNKEIFSLVMIGNERLEESAKIIELKDGYKVDFFHWEGTTRAEFWDAQYSNNKFENKQLIGKNINFSFLVSDDIELWQNHKFSIENQYNTVFSRSGFILSRKKFDIVLVDKVTKKKIAIIFISPSGLIYLFSYKNSFRWEKELFYQDTYGNKFSFSFGQDSHYVIENLAKKEINFNFSNIDEFEIQSDQMDKIKYLLEVSDKSWFYLTADDIWNVKHRYKYVLTDQDHILMQYAFKKIVNDHPHLKKNLLSFKYKRFYQWILNSQEALFYYLNGGHAHPKEHPDRYEFWIDIDNNSDAEWRAFEIWYDIWRNHPESSSGKYLKISIAIALEFANGIRCNCSDEIPNPLKRYELMVWLDSQGIYKTRPLENNSVQELRNIIGFKTGNEDAKWLYLYICKTLGKETNYDFITWGYSLLDYLAYSIYGSVHGSNFYGPKNLGIYRLIKYCGVCGSFGVISAIIANLFGLQSIAIGQPGHCAYIYHNDTSYGYKLGNDISGWLETDGYYTWIQWMFADDYMHHSCDYFYDEFYAISNYIDGFLAKSDEEINNKQGVINDFHALIEKSNKQICINEKSQWGWVKRSQILKYFAKYDYLQDEIRSLKEKAVERINNVFQKFEENRDKLLNYYTK